MTLGKFDAYRIDLKGMAADSCHYDFALDDQFFADVEGQDVQKGHVNVSLNVKKTGSSYELNFQTEGVVRVLCDRCLDEMELPVKTSDCVSVKFGDGYSEEENVITVSFEEGAINVAWLIYEFIALAIPIKHVHPDGMCNEEMSRKLHEHLCEETATFSEDVYPAFPEEEHGGKGDGNETCDPRWNELKKLLDNN